MKNLIASRQRGFTLIELLLAISIIALISTMVMVGQRGSQLKRNDMRRVTDAAAIQKALAVYMSLASVYPVYTGCIDGSDAVTAGLRIKGILGPTDKIVDPVDASDAGTCYYYSSTAGSTYTFRYTLETSSTSGKAGPVTVSP
jgi:prepilin-type N-terminal cleavage/methylation domain-containing protein